MTLHFESLWEKCEKLHQEADEGDNSQEIIDKLIMKLTMYNKMVEKTDQIPQEIKYRLLGEILLDLTNLSLKEDINVYEALNNSFQHRSIDYYSKKYE